MLTLLARTLLAGFYVWGMSDSVHSLLTAAHPALHESAVTTVIVVLYAVLSYVIWIGGQMDLSRICVNRFVAELRQGTKCFQLDAWPTFHKMQRKLHLRAWRRSLGAVLIAFFLDWLTSWIYADIGTSLEKQAIEALLVKLALITSAAWFSYTQILDDDNEFSDWCIHVRLVYDRVFTLSQQQ